MECAGRIKDKKEALIQKMNFPKKWTSLKKRFYRMGIT